MDDFDDIDVEDKHHIIINVKDFRAILQHACTTSGILSAQYSEPCKPLRFSYSDKGLFCQFVLMTVGVKKGSGMRKDISRVRNNNGQTAQPTLSAMASTVSAASVEAAPRLSNRAEPRPSQAAGLPSTARTAPIVPAVNSGFEMRPPLAPPSTIRVEALYDEDSQWEPVNPEEDNSGFVQIEWDESLRPVSFFFPASLEKRKGGFFSREKKADCLLQELAFVPIANAQDTQDDEPSVPDASGGLEPTQRLTQVY